MLVAGLDDCDVCELFGQLRRSFIKAFLTSFFFLHYMRGVCITVILSQFFSRLRRTVAPLL